MRLARATVVVLVSKPLVSTSSFLFLSFGLLVLRVSPMTCPLSVRHAPVGSALCLYFFIFSLFTYLSALASLRKRCVFVLASLCCVSPMCLAGMFPSVGSSKEH